MSTDIPVEAMMAKFEADAREHDREVRIATLVEAARLVCVHCKNEEEWLHHPIDRPHRVRDAFRHWTQWDYEGECYAADIIAKLAEIWGEQCPLTHIPSNARRVLPEKE